jgi:hypothetical protein
MAAIANRNIHALIGFAFLTEQTTQREPQGAPQGGPFQLNIVHFMLKSPFFVKPSLNSPFQ